MDHRTDSLFGGRAGEESMEPGVQSWPRYSRAVFVALATIMAATVALWGGNGEAKSCLLYTSDAADE